jgi:hypothetical protein
MLNEVLTTEPFRAETPLYFAPGNTIGRRSAGVPEVLPASPKQKLCWRAGYRAAIRHIEPVPKV